MAVIEVFSYRQNLIDHLTSILVGSTNNIKDLSSYAIVFPGKRPGLYLTGYLAEKIKSSFFPPHIFTTTEFMGYISGNKAAETTLLNAVYEIFKIIKDLKIDSNNKNFEVFEYFVPWGIEIFKAIEEFDTELVDDNKLKGIDLPGIPDTARNLLANLSSIRKEFHNRLRQKYLTTRGLLYREAAQTVREKTLDEFKHIYFVGLVVLTRAETEVIKHILKNKDASFLTQIESLNEPIISSLKQNLEVDVEVKDSLDVEMPVISLHEAFNTHEEVEYVYNILKDKKPELSRTAIVLPEPATLLPLLANVMDYFPYDYNVTMGYPLKRTPFYTLINNIFNAQKKLTRVEPHTYYAKDYLRVLKHPYIKGMHEQIIHPIVQQIEQYIINKGESFISLETIEDINNESLYSALVNSLENAERPASRDLINSYIKELHLLFFKPFEPARLTTTEFANALDKVIQAILKNSSALQYKFSLSFIKGLFDIIEELRCAEFKEESFDKQMLFKLFDSYVQMQTIPFNGIPLKGLQILGLLETRVLNFDTVVILDCNDGIVPSVSKYEPLLPLPIKKILNLPTYSEHEQVFRYHFRRLIKTANDVHLIYKNNEDMERSRFIEEIIWDQEKEEGRLFDFDNGDTNTPTSQGKITFVKKQHRTEMVSSNKTPIEKTRDIEDKIIKFISIKKGLSPTRIDEYLNCPARFYYSYILELQETEMLEEELEAKDIGTFIHNVLELFYQNYIGKTYSYDSSHNKILERIIENSFKNTFPGEDKGVYFLLKEIIKRLLTEFIKQDGENNKPYIISLEKHLTTELSINGFSVQLNGKIDRIDRKEDEYIIIDYKTGSRASIPKITKLMQLVEHGYPDSALSSREQMKEIIVSFQLPIYLYLLHEKANEFNIKESNWEHLNASLYMIRDKNDINKQLFKSKNKREELMNLFLNSLKKLILEIMDQATPFRPDDTDENYCKYCPFSIMCR